MRLGTAAAAEVLDDTWIPTICDMCYNRCNIRVHRVNGVAVKIEGTPGAPPNLGKTCAKGNSALMSLYSPYRIKTPLIRTNPQKGIGVDPGWKPISWEEALELFAEKVRAARAKDPRTICLASFDTTSRVLSHTWMVAAGSPNHTTAAAGYFCGNGVHPVSFAVTGAFDVHCDLEHCNYCLIFGSSYGFVGHQNAMGLAQEMADRRMQGMRLVVVDPVCTNAASQADEWVPIRPGTDAALALGMMQVMVNELSIYDAAYLTRYSNGPYLVGADGRYLRDRASTKPLVWNQEAGRAEPYDAMQPETAALVGKFEVEGQPARTGFECLRQHLEQYTPERVSGITTVPAATVRRLAREYAEAALIGSTIHLEGYMLPHRPAVALWYRGVSAHQHGMHNGMALAQLNMLIGNIDVPGGLLQGGGGAGPGWLPQEGPDGMLVPHPDGGGMKAPHKYDFRVRKPETLEMVELFPLAIYARAMVWLGVLEGEKFGIEYKPEVLINCRANLLATGGEPQLMSEALKRIPFIVCMGVFHDEGTEFADLLLPDAHGLERLVPMVNNPHGSSIPAKKPLVPVVYQGQFPVVKRQGEARYWIEVLFEVAARAGFRGELYSVLNATAKLKGPHRLDTARTYTFQEIFDRSARSLCGEEHGYEYFRQHGYSLGEEFSVLQAYPRVFHRARMPLYLEHFIEAGQQVRAYMDGRGIAWDTSDYVALVHWQPCRVSVESPAEYDLYVVNQKLPYMTHSFTAENPWLVEVADHSGKAFPVAINEATARRKGITDGDLVELETPDGLKGRGVARLTQGVHPDCVNVAGVLGRWVTSTARGAQGVNFNSLLGFRYDRLDTVSCALDACSKVRVRKVG